MSPSTLADWPNLAPVAHTVFDALDPSRVTVNLGMTNSYQYDKQNIYCYVLLGYRVIIVSTPNQLSLNANLILQSLRPSQRLRCVSIGPHWRTCGTATLRRPGTKMSK